MNQVLLAPQFGVGRAKLREPDETPRSSAREAPPDAAAVFAPGATGPQVTFKRRRVLEVPKQGSADELPAASVAKAPKVYQVSQVVVVAAAEVREEPPVLAPAVAVPEEPEPTPKLRRRRDPSRQPMLVQHLVFETATESISPVAQAAAALETAGDKLDSQQLRDALATLDAELQRVARCEEAYRELDQHLKHLRVGKSDR